MPDKKSKIEKVDDAFDKADTVADAVKEFTPDPIDNRIDEYKGLAKAGWQIGKILGGLFKKKK